MWPIKGYAALILFEQNRQERGESQGYFLSCNIRKKQFVGQRIQIGANETSLSLHTGTSAVLDTDTNTRLAQSHLFSLTLVRHIC